MLSRLAHATETLCDARMGDMRTSQQHTFLSPVSLLNGLFGMDPGGPFRFESVESIRTEMEGNEWPAIARNGSLLVQKLSSEIAMLLADRFLRYCTVRMVKGYFEWLLMNSASDQFHVCGLVAFDLAAGEARKDHLLATRWRGTGVLLLLLWRSVACACWRDEGSAMRMSKIWSCKTFRGFAYFVLRRFATRSALRSQSAYCEACAY